MGARGFFVRAQGMYRLLRTLAGRPRTQAIVSYLSQLFGPWWSCSSPESIAMFRGELHIL
ncbi:hypothetical protein BHE74_00059029, partial [Ensete ventricosum]